MNTRGLLLDYAPHQDTEWRGSVMLVSVGLCQIGSATSCLSRVLLKPIRSKTKDLESQTQSKEEKVETGETRGGVL